MPIKFTVELKEVYSVFVEIEDPSITTAEEACQAAMAGQGEETGKEFSHRLGKEYVTVVNEEDKERVEDFEFSTPTRTSLQQGIYTMTTTTFEIQKNLVLSTAHMTEEDDGILSETVYRSTIGDVLPYGWRIYVPHESGEFVRRKRVFKGDGMSPSFLKAFQLSFDLECDWMVFDLDGPIYEDEDRLDIHDW